MPKKNSQKSVKDKNWIHRGKVVEIGNLYGVGNSAKMIWDDMAVPATVGVTDPVRWGILLEAFRGASGVVICYSDLPPAGRLNDPKGGLMAERFIA